eukprot:scaffold249_cov262-Chaetoceros_neogracile.AAC.17
MAEALSTTRATNLDRQTRDLSALLCPQGRIATKNNWTTKCCRLVIGSFEDRLSTSLSASFNICVKD